MFVIKHASHLPSLSELRPMSRSQSQEILMSPKKYLPKEKNILKIKTEPGTTMTNVTGKIKVSDRQTYKKPV